MKFMIGCVNFNPSFNHIYTENSVYVKFNDYPWTSENMIIIETRKWLHLVGSYSYAIHIQAPEIANSDAS